MTPPKAGTKPLKASLFASVWRALCDIHGLKQVDFKKRANMPQSHINRLWKGEYAPSSEDFKKIVAIACHTDEETARLVQARMLDYCEPQFRRLVKISVREARKSQPGTEAYSELAPEVQQSITYFMERAKQSPVLADSVVQMAKMLSAAEPDNPPEESKRPRKPGAT